MEPLIKKALVVEDNPLNNELMKMMLEDIGYTVLTASDGDVGLEILEKEPAIELIVTDIFMPKKEGIGLIRAVRSRHLHVKIVAVTGAVNFTAISETAMQFGADLIIKKPFDLDDFAEKLKSLTTVH